MPENPYQSPEAELPEAPARSPWKEDLIESLVISAVAVILSVSVIALIWWTN